MDQRKSLIVTGLVGLLILVIIFGTIFYLFRFLTNRAQSINPTNLIPQATTSGNPSLPVVNTNPTQSPSATARPGTNNESSTNSNLKTYNGEGFVLEYPRVWGLLTCNNSGSFEFDPENGNDNLNVSCDSAQESITVRSVATSCGGTSITLGNVQVNKSSRTVGGDTYYTWCVSEYGLEFSHRVSPDVYQGFSQRDYSADVENVISTLRSGQAS